MKTATHLARRVLKNDTRVIAALMTRIENRDPAVRNILKALYPHTGRALVVGVTGVAGAGKSSLIDRMTSSYRRRKKNVAVLAVDPSSRSSGALLGDRIRMREHYLDNDVFIRSFATRHGVGGLSPAVHQAVHVLDAAGKDVILVETIGVGQDQLEIGTLAHQVIVVLTPHMGDEVQSMKGGLLEIADTVVVHKADLEGAEATVQQLQAQLAADGTPILTTTIYRSGSVESLVDHIEAERKKSLTEGKQQEQRLQMCRHELLSLLREQVWSSIQARVGDGSFEKQVERLAQRKVDPYSAADAMAKKLGLGR